jgi:rod shape-determining protein MreC
MRRGGRRDRVPRLEVRGGGGGYPGTGRGSTPSGNPVVALLVLLAIGIGLGVLHNRLKKAGRTDPALAVVRTGLYPFQKGAAFLYGGVNLNFNWLLRGREVQTENTRLAAENARLKQENESLRKAAAEVTRLRVALHLVKAEKLPPLAAEVIGWLPSPHFDTIVLARGSRDGVKERMVVRTADGLVGQVIDVGPASCEVMLLSDLNSGVGGLVRRNNKSQGVGIVQGVGRGMLLEVQYLKREADVKPGDVVVSSGYGGVVPPDIPIGVVESVVTDDARFLKTARVTPAAPLPGDLREALILR